jgi:preprotein translocase subunit SecG
VLLINQLSLGLLQLAAVADVIRGAVMVLFFVSAVLVILVVLAQEGKGGGLAGAFGGAGAETFGVKAGTVNKFTAWLAAAFLGLALLHAGLGSFTAEDKGAPDIKEFSDDATPEDGKKDDEK